MLGLQVDNSLVAVNLTHYKASIYLFSQIPALTGADVENGATNHDLSPSVVNQVHSSSEIIPDNVLAINDQHDVVTLKSWASQFATDVATTPSVSLLYEKGNILYCISVLLKLEPLI